MKVERAMHLALADNFTPTPHQQAGASYVLAKEVERLREELERLQAVQKAAKQFYETCWLAFVGPLEVAARYGPECKPLTNEELWGDGQKLVDALAASAAKAGGDKRDPYLQGIMEGWKGESDESD